MSDVYKGGKKYMTEDDVLALIASASQGNPVGTIIASMATGLDGYLLCDGAAYSSATYPELAAILAVDGSSVFEVPDMRGRVLWGVESGQVPGQELEPGLPNIEGSFTSRSIGNANGAFYAATSSAGAAGSGSTASTTYNIILDASRSSSIYGASDTVQPPAIAVNYFIRCGTVVPAQGTPEAAYPTGGSPDIQLLEGDTWVSIRDGYGEPIDLTSSANVIYINVLSLNADDLADPTVTAYVILLSWNRMIVEEVTTEVASAAVNGTVVYYRQYAIHIDPQYDAYDIYSAVVQITTGATVAGVTLVGTLNSATVRGTRHKPE